MITSPLRYPGAKSRALKVIAPLIPEFEDYVEPFLGGGSVFLHVKQLFPGRRYWVNDAFPELFNFWCQLERDPLAFYGNTHWLMYIINAWKKQYFGKDLFNHCHEVLNGQTDECHDEHKAAAFYILNRITFSGLTLSGGYSQLAYEGRFTDSAILRLEEVSALLRCGGNTHFSGVDYEECIKNPLIPSNTKRFIFLDPPYYTQKKSRLYGKNGGLHVNFDHERLCKVLKACPHKWLMTIDDCEYIRDLFSFANIREFSLMYGMNNVGGKKDLKRNELLITNYELPVL